MVEDTRDDPQLDAEPAGMPDDLRDEAVRLIERYSSAPWLIVDTLGDGEHGLVILRVGDVPPWMEQLDPPPHHCTEAPDPCPWIRYRMTDYPTTRRERR